MKTIDTVNIRIPNSRLAEGSVHTFRIIRSLTLAPGEDYYVLQDPMGYRIMMPLNHYVNYGFSDGQEIRCRVDKVNCNGRVFLEPLHPFYTEGEVYSFQVIESGSNQNILDEPEYYFLVSDVLGAQWKVVTSISEALKENPSHIKCLVKRIKKGTMFLVPERERSPDPCPAPGLTLSCLIIDERVDRADGLAYFILQDGVGARYRLRKKYYKHYGLRKGDRISCIALERTADAAMVLEPKHPCYEVGEMADFRLVRLENLMYSDGAHQKVLVLSDCYGEDVKVHVDDDTADRIRGGDTIRAKVTGIYKSRLELELEL